MFKIGDDNLLEVSDKIIRVKCDKNKKLFGPGNPDSIIIHFTAGSSAESSVKSLCNPTDDSSAHVVVGRNGIVYQMVPFNTIAWHAGVSEYKGKKWFNNCAIGIEIDNAGELTETNGRYVSWFGKVYPSEDVFVGIHRNQKTKKYWHAYPDTQVLIVEELCRALISKYPNIKTILGHEEIAPDRKTDPGPAFPLDSMRISIFNDKSLDGLNEF